MDNGDFWNGIIGQHADTQLRVTKAVAPGHRGWSIEWDYGRFVATGPDYDASYEGEEDGWVDNGQRVSARTWDGVIEEIDAWFEEYIAPTPPIHQQDRSDDN